MYYFLFFFFNDTATTEIYTLSLHDALPILGLLAGGAMVILDRLTIGGGYIRQQIRTLADGIGPLLDSPDQLKTSTRWKRSEEHTSELQSRLHLVCRLLLEKKKKYHI